MDSDYIVQIDIDPVAKDNEYDFTTEKEICDTDTTLLHFESFQSFYFDLKGIFTSLLDLRKIDVCEN